MISSNTKLKQAQQELKAADQEIFLLKQILASSSEPILITNTDLKIIYVNPAWESLTGYTFEEVCGRNPNINKSGKTSPEVYLNIKKLLKKSGTYTTEEIVNKKKDGSFYQVHCTFYSVVKNNQPLFYVQIMHDITKRKSIETLKNEILASTAHELKTPVTVLKLLTEIHLNRRLKKRPDKMRISDLALMNRELDKLTRLINDILESIRSETEVSLHYQRFDLVQIVKEVATEVKPLYPKHKLIVKNKAEILIEADKDRIEQVVTNLIINAAKYSSEKSLITLSIANSLTETTFSVTDQGIGIPVQKRPFVFDKFYKGEKSRPGFGIGLYVAQQIIKLHGGEIWFETKEKKGSIFYFSLPKRKIENG